MKVAASQQNGFSHGVSKRTVGFLSDLFMISVPYHTQGVGEGMHASPVHSLCRTLGIISFKKKTKNKISCMSCYSSRGCCWIFLSCCLDASEECLQMYYAKNKLSQINNNKRMNLKKKNTLNSPSLKLLNSYVYLTGAIKVDFCPWENLTLTCTVCNLLSFDVKQSRPFVLNKGHIGNEPGLLESLLSLWGPTF